MTDSRIFVVSLHKCMTRSTDMLLSMLGFSTVHFPKFFRGENLMESVRGLEGDPEAVVDRLMPVLADRHAASDVPIPGLYRTLAHRFPESRFILVLRDPHAWADSVHRHLRKRRLSPYNEIQYRPYLGPSSMRASEIPAQRLAEVHEQHRADVERFFATDLDAPERLCVVDARTQPVGETICGFLGLPPRPLPRVSGRSGEEDLAISREWVRLRPDKQEAHYLLAKNLLGTGDLAAAEASARDAIAAEPDQPKPYALLSGILMRTERVAEARAMARRAVEYGLYRRRLFYQAAAGALRNGELGAACRLWGRGVRQA